MARTVDQVLVTYDTLRRSSMETAVLGSYARRMAGTVGTSWQRRPVTRAKVVATGCASRWVFILGL